MASKRQKIGSRKSNERALKSNAVQPTDPEDVNLPSPKSWKLQVGVIMTVALALRLLHFAAMSKTPIYEVRIGDAWQYDRWGQSIASGEWIGSEIFYQTPLYPYFLGVVYSIFGHSVWVVRILQACFGGLACVLLARAGTRLFDQRAGWTAGLLLAAYPPAIFFDGILQKASIDLVLVCGLLWIISRQQQRLSLVGVISLGLMLGGLILNRENAWVLFPILVAWLGWLSWFQTGFQLRLLPVPVLILAMALILLPVGLRNYYVGGEFLLTTSQMGPNFYIGNHRGAPGWYVSLRPDRGDPRFESTDARVLAELGEGRVLTPREVSRYWMRRSREDIVADPVGWMRLLARKWFMTWNQLELVDGEGIRVHARYSPTLGGLLWICNFGVISALGAAGVWFTARRWKNLWVLYGLTLAFALAVTIFYVFARYRYPLVPMVVLFAAAGIVHVVRSLRNDTPKKWLEIGGAVGLAVVVGIFTCLPQLKRHSDEVTYFSVGTALNDLERYDEAVQQFQLALKENPDFPPAYINMSTSAMARKDWQTAEHLVRRALEIDPTSVLAYAKLSQVQVERGDVDGALQSLAEALKLDPNSFEALRSSSRLELRRGNAQLAVGYMQKAVSIFHSSDAAHAELGLALIANGQLIEAAHELTESLRLQPSQLLVANNLAWLLATGPDSVLDGGRAVELAEEVCRQSEYKLPDFLDTLAAAYAAAGDFGNAVKTAQRIVEWFVQKGDNEKEQTARQRLELYQQGRAYRDPELETK